MLEQIIINYETIELLQFYWETAAKKNKMNESYFLEIAQKPEMQIIYTDDFNQESVRKVLSAVMNYEPVNNATAKELEFYNYNKFNADDPGNVEMMFPPVKTLNVDELKTMYPNTQQSQLIINFVPAYDMVYRIDDNQLTINFFKLTADWSDMDNVYISGQILKEFVLDKAKEILD